MTYGEYMYEVRREWGVCPPAVTLALSLRPAWLILIVRVGLLRV